MPNNNGTRQNVVRRVVVSANVKAPTRQQYFVLFQVEMNANQR
jgi:hypothetical protein